MSEWRVVRLGDLFNVKSSKRIYASEYVEDGVPFYRSREIIEIRKNKKIISPLYISESRYKELAERHGAPKKGDILITSVGTIGTVWFVEQDKFYFKDGNLNWIESNIDEVTGEFIYYWLDSSVGYNNIINQTIGTSQSALTLQALKKLKIYIPNKITMEKISNVLSTYDKLIENNNRRIQILEQTAEELYKEWFVRMRFPGYEKTKFDKGIPEDWKSLKLEDVCELVRGISYRTKDVENDRGTPMMTLKSVKSYGGYNEGGIRYYDNEINERHILQENDILMAITDMTQDKRVIGQAFLVPTLLEENVVFSADLILLDELKIDPEYFYSMLRFGGLSNHIATYSNGANVLHLNQRTLNKIKLIVAPKILREKYSNKYKYIQKEINILERNNKNLINQRDLLLPRLMNGTITVK